jgi:hypothetical protein
MLNYPKVGLKLFVSFAVTHLYVRFCAEHLVSRALSLYQTKTICQTCSVHARSMQDMQFLSQVVYPVIGKPDLVLEHDSYTCGYVAFRCQLDRFSVLAFSCCKPSCCLRACSPSTHALGSVDAVYLLAQHV